MQNFQSSTKLLHFHWSVTWSRDSIVNILHDTFAMHLYMDTSGKPPHERVRTLSWCWKDISEFSSFHHQFLLPYWGFAQFCGCQREIPGFWLVNLLWKGCDWPSGRLIHVVTTPNPILWDGSVSSLSRLATGHFTNTHTHSHVHTHGASPSCKRLKSGRQTLEHEPNVSDKPPGEKRRPR